MSVEGMARHYIFYLKHLLLPIAALHAPYFQGMLLQTDSGPASTVVMMPGQAMTVDMLAERDGLWPFYCGVHDHLEAGMFGSLNITMSIR